MKENPTFPTITCGTFAEALDVRFRLKCKLIHDTVFKGRRRLSSTNPSASRQRLPVFFYFFAADSTPLKDSRDGGGAPDADDLAGPERGRRVPVQPVR